MAKEAEGLSQSAPQAVKDAMSAWVAPAPVPGDIDAPAPAALVERD